MKTKTFSAAGEVLFIPLCVCALAAAGCASQIETPMPNGAFVSEPQTKKPVSPAPAEVQKTALPAVREEIVEETIVFDLNPQEPAEDPAVLPPEAKPKAASEAKPAAKPEVKPAAAPAVKADAKPVAKTSDQEIRYKIKKGDTLSAIAAHHKMSAAALAEYNGIPLNKILQIGETIGIPVSAAEAGKLSADKPAAKDVKEVKAAKDAKKDDKAAKDVKSPAPAVAGGEVYIVKPGDTLGGIAHRHSVKVAQIAELNKIDPKAILPAGKKLILPQAAKTQSGVKTADAKPAAKTAVKTDAEKIVKPAEKATAKPVEKAVAKPVENVVRPTEKTDAPQKETSADDIIGAIGNESASAPVKAAETSPAAPAPASSAISVAPQNSGIDEALVIAIPLDREMTLEEVSRIYDRNYQALKKLNPGITENQKIKAGTLIKMPMF